jgi:hypothetical protein
MAVEDLQSPPYPNEGTTADGLLTHLRALRAWVGGYRESHNKLAGQDLIPAPKKPPQKEAYAALPVLTQMSHLLFMRKVREQWDHLVRTYEADWDDQLCVRQRVMLLASSAVLLNSGFAPYEQREFRRRAELEECQRTLDSVAQALRDIMEPQAHEPDQEAPGA